MQDIRKRGRIVREGPWLPYPYPDMDDVTTCSLWVGSNVISRFCGHWHRTEGASKRHCEKLNRKEARGK